MRRRLWGALRQTRFGLSPAKNSREQRVLYTKTSLTFLLSSSSLTPSLSLNFWDFRLFLFLCDFFSSLVKITEAYAYISENPVDDFYIGLVGMDKS